MIIAVKDFPHDPNALGTTDLECLRVEEQIVGNFRLEPFEIGTSTPPFRVMAPYWVSILSSLPDLLILRTL
ncbi:MAG: hypothetical protein AAGA85_05860 [Bacteroidota bacterium]